jgi:hypothetical protein
VRDDDIIALQDLKLRGTDAEGLAFGGRIKAAGE